MKAVIQRVTEAKVDVDGETIGAIDKGIVLFLGIHKDDGEKELEWLLNKSLSLRIFEDEQGKMNLSLQDIGGEMLIISQFTLYGDCRKGRRPGFSDAAPAQIAKPLYERFVEKAKGTGIVVGTGIFGADMKISLVNAGPVTMLLDTHHLQGDI